MPGRDAQRLEACFEQGGVPALVALGPITTVMRFTIDLDCKACLQTREIDDVIRLWKLAAELQVAWSLAESLPEKDFGKRHVLAEATGPFYVFDRGG